MALNPKLLLWSLLAWGLESCASQQSLVSVDLSGCALAPSLANAPVGSGGATVNLLARFHDTPVQNTRVVWSALGCDMLPASTQTDGLGNGHAVAHCNSPRQSLLSAALAVSGQSLPLPNTPALKFYAPADGNVAISVGTPMNLLAVARTAAGAIDPSYRGKVHVSSSDPNASLPEDYTFAAADHGVKVWPDAVVLRSSGLQSVTVQDTATRAVLHRETFELVSTGVTQLRVQTASAPVAGVAQDVTVSALDSSGAVNPFYLGSIVFSSSDPNAILPLSTTFNASDAGVVFLPAALVWKTRGAHNVGAQDAALGVAGAASVTVSDAGADHLDLTVPSSALAGVAQAAQVRVLDAYGNVATSYRGALHFSASDSAATLPPDTALSAADAGSYAWLNALVWRSTGPQALTVADS